MRQFGLNSHLSYFAWCEVVVLSAGHLPLPVPYNNAENRINIIVP